MWCRVILPRNNIKGEITEHYFYRTLSIHQGIEHTAAVTDNEGWLKKYFHSFWSVQDSSIESFLIIIELYDLIEKVNWFLLTWLAHFWPCLNLVQIDQGLLKGEDEKRSGYMRYVQGIQPNVPAHTTCRHGLYNSMVHARTGTYIDRVPYFH